ncbi:MFS multidrug transporter protein [Rutstroemia sp. NJR-2017a BVV2]|nr:MFS multidrug transporter protein [Rutstroemia sp. NJR-2017a BVV2]
MITSYQFVSDPESSIEVPQAELSPPYSIFVSRQKLAIITLASIGAAFSGLAGNIYFPAIPILSRSLNTTPELINLTVTSYMIMQGLSPTIWGALSDVHGRKITYLCTFTVFIGACIGLAETQTFAQLVVLRCLQSAGSASTIAVGAGVMGDITTREERGGYMGYFQAGNLVPVALAPVLGGIFAQTVGWRAIFWFLAAFGGTYLILETLLLPETLRSIVGNGSLPTKGIQNSVLKYIHRRRHPELFEPEKTQHSLVQAPKAKTVDFLGPIKILFAQESILIIIFLSLYYTAWQMIITCMSTLFSDTYHLTEIQIGLTFLGNGFGSIVGTLTTGKLLDLHYRRVKNAYSGPPEDFPLEQARFRLLYAFSLLEIAAVITFGWTLDKGVHISVPIICTFALGWAVISIYSVIATYMVDVWTKQSASGTAALNLSRCLIGSGGTAAILPIVRAVGVGWAFTICTGVLVLSLGLVVVQMRWGGKWRRKREKKAMESEGSA